MSVRRVRRPAPAKVNLGLRVVGRRADGYHELDSVFVPLDLADDVEIAVCEADDVQVSVRVQGERAGVPDDASNLAARAAAAFARACGLLARIEVTCHKRIPVGGGLGGGSSDAGAVLRGLAELYPDARPKPPLFELALGLGADVPFFLDPRPARVGGIGERIEPLEGVPPFWVLLANPGAALATADVFRAFDAPSPALTQPGGGRTIPPPRAPWGSRELSEVPVANDLLPAAVRLCPPVGRLLDRIRATGVPAGMSGSGATVFGVYGSEAAAEQARESLRAESLGAPPAWMRVAAKIESL